MDMVFAVTVAVLCGGFVLERVLEYLDMKAMSPVLPDRLEGFYDRKEYDRFQRYRRDGNRLDQVSSSFSFVVMMTFLCAGGFGWWNTVVVSWTSDAVWQTLVFMLGLSLASSVLSLPFEWYSTFRIEQKYGFNTSSRKLFWVDFLKGQLVSLSLGGLVLAAVVFFYIRTGSDFWLYAWGTVSLFSLFISMFYVRLIVPIFNRLTPLEPGSLRDRICRFARDNGFRLDNIYVMDGSRRSTKANAYFAGMGPVKRVVLYDTLVSGLEEEEIVAVLAHEVGHYRHRHNLQFMLASILQTGILFRLFALLVDEDAFSVALGGEEACFQLGLLAFAILYSPVSTVIGTFMNLWSRHNEYQADRYAATHYDGAFLISGLKKISVKALSNLTPHPLYEWVYYSHPSLLKRIDAISRIGDEINDTDKTKI